MTGRVARPIAHEGWQLYDSTKFKTFLRWRGKDAPCYHCRGPLTFNAPDGPGRYEADCCNRVYQVNFGEVSSLWGTHTKTRGRGLWSIRPAPDPAGGKT